MKFHHYTFTMYTKGQLSNNDLQELHDLLLGHGFDVSIIASQGQMYDSIQKNKEEDLEAQEYPRKDSRTSGVPLPYGKTKSKRPQKPDPAKRDSKGNRR